VDQAVISRFLRGKRSVMPATRLKMESWVRVHGPPQLRTKASSKPKDYYMNLDVHAATHMCGVPFARLDSVLRTTGVGRMNSTMDTRVKENLLEVLQLMDEEDTTRLRCTYSHSVLHCTTAPPPDCVALHVLHYATVRYTALHYAIHYTYCRAIRIAHEYADYRLGFNGCHEGNREARAGFGTFMSNTLGLCLLCVCVDKYKDKLCAGAIPYHTIPYHTAPSHPIPSHPTPPSHLSIPGISQRIERRALLLGLHDLYTKWDFKVTAVCTDQCKAAGVDIKAVAKVLSPPPPPPPPTHASASESRQFVLLRSSGRPCLGLLPSLPALHGRSLVSWAL
jgi:hypothetical protein